jgi:hypothetical protein
LSITIAAARAADTAKLPVTTDESLAGSAVVQDENVVDRVAEVVAHDFLPAAHAEDFELVYIAFA